jgi:hypothetical protein
VSLLYHLSIIFPDLGIVTLGLRLELQALRQSSAKRCAFPFSTISPQSSVIIPALMMRMNEAIIDRIAFGGVKELEELYQ